MTGNYLRAALGCVLLARFEANRDQHDIDPDTVDTIKEIELEIRLARAEQRQLSDKFAQKLVDLKKSQAFQGSVLPNEFDQLLIELILKLKKAINISLPNGNEN